MKNGNNLVAKLAKASAEKAMRRDANRTACFGLFQPKVPVGMDRFRKPQV